MLQYIGNCEHSLVVKHELPKLRLRVRFPLLAPIKTPHKYLQFKCLCGVSLFFFPLQTPTQTTPKTRKKVVRKRTAYFSRPYFTQIVRLQIVHTDMSRCFVLLRCVCFLCDFVGEAAAVKKVLTARIYI